MLLGLSVALAALLLDQLSKYYVLHEVLGEMSAIAYTSFFNLVRAWNTGVSFSMFNDYGSLGTIMLSVVASGIVLFLLVWLKDEENSLSQIALGLVIGGAVGNIIDRVRLGAVFDFLDFHVAGHHWPAFNLADSFICIGAAILVLQGIFNVISKEGVKK